MRKTLRTYTHDTFGSTRILYDGTKTVFCANDVARALGFRDPWSAARNHCYDREIHFCQGKNMNFINFLDLLNLASAADREVALAYVDWVLFCAARLEPREDEVISDDEENDAGITINITVDADNLFSWLADHLNARVGVSE